MSRILVFSRDPGGANSVIPLVKPLCERGHKLLLYGKDAALGKYRLAGCDGTDIMHEIPLVAPDAISAFIDKHQPDVIVTATSADDFVEKFLWRASGEMNIPSLAIIDQWVNYGLRFSRYGVNDIEEYIKDRTPQFLPTRIVAMDDYARSEMIAEGLPAERVVVCGQPYFQSLLASRSETGDLRQYFAGKGIAPDDHVVVFASEPITTTYGTGGFDYFGYTEKTVLDALVRSLEKVAGETKRKIVLVVRPHPKEGSDHFRDIVGQCLLVRCCFDADSAPWTLMNRADLVCGMSSMFLLESVILGRSMLSIQIGLHRENPFVLARRGIVQSIVTEQKLVERLRLNIFHGEVESPHFDVIVNPVERTIKEVEKLLCHN